MPSLIDPFKPVSLSNKEGSVTVEVLPLGLNVHRILINKDPLTGKVRDVIAGPENPKDHHTYGRKFFGPVVGRYANRLPKGKSAFPGGGHIDLKEWRAGDGLCLHGGPEEEGDKLASIEEGTVPPQAGPFDRCIWTPVTSSELFEKESSSPSIAIFAIVSPADANGYPGTLRVEARFEVLDKPVAKTDKADLGKALGALRLEYRARILDDCKATPVSLTHHWGFTLNAPDSINDHTLRLIPPPGRQVKLLDVDGKLLPTGKTTTIEPKSTHDFASSQVTGLGRTIGKEAFDHFYVWGLDSDESHTGEAAESAAELDDETRCLFHSPKSKLALAFRTNQAGCQFFSTNKLPKEPTADPAQAGGVRKALHAAEEGHKQGNQARCGAMLEFGMPHATFLHKELIDETGGRDTILRNGETYENWVEVGVYATDS